MRFSIGVNVFVRLIRHNLSTRSVATMSEPLKEYDTVKCRQDPVILKLESQEFKSVLTDEVCLLRDIFDKYKYELRLAGGPVRDLLSGIVPKDLDFATTATPTEMKTMFAKEGIRLINLNGEKHGTITARINDKENFEVTTLRIDVVTDGRHAQVQFTSDWKLDANRRDLTINSMFLDFDGLVYDYFYGYDDLLAKRVSFVGDADTRIKEDYLRILRYFRFFGRISDNPQSHNVEILQRIKENINGLDRISGERIWVELKKILLGNFSGELLKTMLELDMGKHIGLPEEPNLMELERIYNGTKEKLHPITLLATQLKTIEDAINMNSRLKFSVLDRDLAYFIVEHREPKLSKKPLLPYQKLLVNAKNKSDVARDYIIEALKYLGDEGLLNDFRHWQMPKFYHVSVPLLNRHGAVIPKFYATIIHELKMIWAENDFSMPFEELEKEIPALAAKYNKIGNTKKRKNSKE